MENTDIKINNSSLPPNTDGALQHDYVLILELLHSDDDLTGTLLAEHIEQYSQLPIEYRSCASGEDLLAALREAQASVEKRGYPIVHLEAHGMKRVSSASPGGIAVDHNGNGFVSWHHVWNALRELNIATDFNLLVVAASCHGDDVIYGLAQDNQEHVKPVPFVATLGFDATVGSAALLDAMSAFYENLEKGGPLNQAVQAANRTITPSARLTLRWAVKELADAIQEFGQCNLDGSNAEYYWRRHLEHFPETPETQKERILAEIRSFERVVIDHLQHCWLAFDTHPHNKTRFAFLFPSR